jgi:hypothetical protein
MARKDAIAAIDTAVKLLETARTKLREVIALKLLTSEDVSFERAEVAPLDREINDLRDLLTQLRAGSSVIPAPSPAEIRAALGLLDQLAGLVAQDAAVAGGLELITTGLATAREFREKVPV